VTATSTHFIRAQVFTTNFIHKIDAGETALHQEYDPPVQDDPVQHCRIMNVLFLLKAP